MPALFCCANNELSVKPAYPTFHNEQSTVLRVVPMPQVEQAIKASYSSTNGRVENSQQDLTYGVRCVPQSLVEQYPVHSASLQSIKRRTAPNKRRLIAQRVMLARERYVLDLIERTRDPDGGHKYIAHITDHATKFRYAEALLDKSAESIVKFLIKVFRLHGRPKILHTDNGKEFKNALVTNLLKQWGVKRVYGRPYKPTTQGVIERPNKTLQIDLSFWQAERKLLSSSWALGVQIVTQRANEMKHSTTGAAAYTIFHPQASLCEEPNDAQLKQIEAIWAVERKQWYDSIRAPFLVSVSEQSSTASSAPAVESIEEQEQEFVYFLQKQLEDDEKAELDEIKIDDQTSMGSSLHHSDDTTIQTNHTISLISNIPLTTDQQPSLSDRSIVILDDDVEEDIIETVQPSSNTRHNPSTQQLLQSPQQLLQSPRITDQQSSLSHRSIVDDVEEDIIETVQTSSNVRHNPTTQLMLLQSPHTIVCSPWGNDKKLVTPYDCLEELHGPYWQTMCHQLPQFLRRRGGLAGGHCAPHAFLNSTKGVATLSDTLSLRTELLGIMFPNLHAPKEPNQSLLNQFTRKLKLKQHSDVQLTDGLHSSFVDDCWEQLMVTDDQRLSSKPTAEYWSQDVLRFCSTLQGFNLFLFTMIQRSHSSLGSEGSQEIRKTHETIELTCELFGAGDNPSHLTHSDHPNTVAILLIIQSQVNQIEEQFIIRDPKSGAFNTHGGSCTGHYESLVDSDRSSCWTSRDPVVQCLMDCAAFTKRLDHSNHQIDKMVQAHDKRQSQNNTSFEIGDLAYWQPTDPLLNALSRSPLKPPGPLPSLLRMPVRVVQRIPLTADHCTSLGEWNVYVVECALGVVVGQLHVHELAACGPEVDPVLHMRPLPTADTIAGPRVAVWSAWAGYISSLPGAAPVKKARIKHDLTRCQTCHVAGGTTVQCSGCFLLIHTEPCQKTGSLRNHKKIIDGLHFHRAECARIYEEGIKETSQFTTTNVSGLESNGKGSTKERNKRKREADAEQVSKRRSQT